MSIKCSRCKKKAEDFSTVQISYWYRAKYRDLELCIPCGNDIEGLIKTWLKETASNV